MASLDTNRGAKRAREARAELTPDDPYGPLACLITTVEREGGIPVGVVALPPGVAGCFWRQGPRMMLWVNGTQHVSRQRFTLAHEFGHVRCGHDGALAVDTFETLSGQTTDSREIQANAFAAEFLAPAAGVESIVNTEPSLEDVVRLAARFGISTIAAVYRIKTLGLTGDPARLIKEIEDELHVEVWERLDPPVPQDIFAALTVHDLPRVPPDSALTALLAGAASVDDVAAAAGCASTHLASGARVVGPR